ncbi:MAG: hypothetical protein NTZ16_15960 [Verrucomicrobia bacterium]|nr:hypothetical protein [Verrucomicrobiota bacterium]
MISLDVFATALSCAGVPMPTDRKYDGVNLIPFLTGEQAGAPHERLFWRSAKVTGMREGEAKLARPAESQDELCDLKSDVGESRNLAAAQPEKAQVLAATLAAWDKELVAPAFPGAGTHKKSNAKPGKKKPAAAHEPGQPD